MNPAELLDYTDYPAIRRRLQQNVLQSLGEAFPVENDRFQLTLKDPRFDGPDTWSLKDQKKAILEGRTLGQKVTGVYELRDVVTGKPVGRTGRKTLLSIPYLTDRGTFIRSGTEYTVTKQLRLVPGVYSRRTEDGMVEAQFNVKPRTGTGFRTYLEPGTGNFYMRYRNRKIPLYPVLRAMGVPHDTVASMWGKDLAEKNRALERSPYAVNFLRQFRPQEPEGDPLAELPEDDVEKEASLQKAAGEVEYTPEIRENLLAAFSADLDPRTSQRTLGRPYPKVSPEVLLSATSKLLRINRGEEDTDSRDSLAFQEVHDVTDFLPEKIKTDQNGILRQMLWKITGKNGDLSRIPSALLNKHVQHLFNDSGLSFALEEVNPFEIHDQNQKIIRLGEGAMSSLDVVPKEARDVQPSYMGYIDPIRSPESLGVGIDMKLARKARKGPDRQLYTEMLDPKTGKPVWVGVWDAVQKKIGLPESLTSKERFVPAMVGDKGMQYVDRKELDYVFPSGDDMFSDGAQTVPLKSGVKGMRLLMGSKHVTQALPLVSREAPLVQTTDMDGAPVGSRMGKIVGAVRAPVSGIVRAVYKDHIDVVDQSGKTSSVETYDNHPFMRKTFIRNMPVVKAGQRVKEGDLLATSNYTDDKGEAALGTNLRVGYMSYDGKVFEDSVVISESAAKKLTSEHMMPLFFEKDKQTTVAKKNYQALYPSVFSKEQLAKVGDNGLVKEGTVLQYGDPLVLAVEDRDPTERTMGRRLRTDASLTWEHPYPGVVTDVAEGKDGFSMHVRSNLPMQVGDKLSGRFGNKGVVADIISDSEMPTDVRGNPLDLIMSPLGVISRTNAAQKIEAQLGKVARKTGKPYSLPGFLDSSMTDFALEELRKNHLSDTEDLIDPRTGKTIPEVFTGVSHIYKLQQTAESKGKSVSTGGYTSEEQPAKGGTGVKHLGSMEYDAILGHGADKVLRDLKLIKGQKNDAFWRQLKLGQTPTMPGTPLVYNKFRNLIKASGVQLREGRFGDQIFAMTDKEAQELTGNRRLQTGATYSDKDMRPLKGGLFDPAATGSETNGDRWSYIQLPEPLPNPVMVDPLRSILGMTKKDFDAMVSGESAVNGKTGGEALGYLLGRIDVSAEKARALDEIKNGAKSKRDAAIKKFRFLEAMDRHKVKPSDFMMSRIPVLPPVYRPIARSKSMTMVADPNYLYKAVLDTIDDYNEAKGMPTLQKEARAAMWKSYQDLVGLTDPDQPKLQDKRVEGILSQMFGKGSPKMGMVQRRVMGTNIDVSGLGSISPNPSLKLNEVGLPEALAWNLYEPFIIRNMVQNGYGATEAAKAVSEHAPAAYKALQEVVKERPVMINRAPTLHKYSVMAMWPILTKGRSLQIPPTIVKPFNADFDGDTMSFSVPVSKDAVDQAIARMMPDKNLISSRFGKPAYAPHAEYAQGLYFATKAPTNKPPRNFRSKKEALDAYRKGEIRIDDPITIVEE